MRRRLEPRHQQTMVRRRLDAVQPSPPMKNFLLFLRRRHWADQRRQVYGAQERTCRAQGWKTFLRNHADGVAATDLFVVPTVSFRLLDGLLIMSHGRRQILWLGVTAQPTAEWMANELTAACGWEQIPRDLVRDRDAVTAAYSFVAFARSAFAIIRRLHARLGRTGMRSA